MRVGRGIGIRPKLKAMSITMSGCLELETVSSVGAQMQLRGRNFGNAVSSFLREPDLASRKAVLAPGVARSKSKDDDNLHMVLRKTAAVSYSWKRRQKV